jgi:hypothetical protein
MWNRRKLGSLPTAGARRMFWPTSVAPNPANVGVTLGESATVYERANSHGEGPMVVYVPASPTMTYTVEYVAPDGFDQGVSQPLVRIHKIVYSDDHPYIVKSIPNGIQDPANPSPHTFVDSSTGIMITANNQAVDGFGSAYANVTISVDTKASQSGWATPREVRGPTIRSLGTV